MNLALMAPNNRKKKKAASNPGRGFATTSTVSRSKFQQDTEALEVSVNEPVEGLQADKGGQSFHDQQIPPEKQPQLHELTPEELERQLEESELQLLLEQHGEKSKKDASRQISRLHTEKRLLRSQADHFIVRSWLPRELMELIELSLNAQFKEIVSPTSVATKTETKTEISDSLPEDGLLIRLWTLEQVLIGLGFQHGRALDAVLHVIQRKAGQKDEQKASKDILWGLEECLDWLALCCDATELPSYTVEPNRSRERSPKGHRLVGESDGTETPTATPATPRTLTPLPRTKEASTESSQEIETGGQSQVSSSESDLDDPEAMIARFLVLQSRLYSLRPDLPDIVEDKRSAKSNNRSSRQDRRFNGLGPDALKLVQKISKLRADILFDGEEAQRQWVEFRNKLARDRAERRRLQIDDGSTQPNRGEVVKHAFRSSTEPDNVEENGEGDASDMLEGLFPSLPEFTTNENTGVTSIQITSSDSVVVTIRDFGKTTGLKPRRVFEEACKARWVSLSGALGSADVQEGTHLVE